MRRGRWVVLAGLVATVALPVQAQARADAPKALVDCSHAAERVQITADTDLDPGCTYTAGFDVTASNVTLDCKGALVASADGAGGVGIMIHTPVDVALTDVTVRNCTIQGFLNSMKVTRDGFRDLADGLEFEHPTERIVLEDNEVRNSRGVGIYVDGYVSGVTIRDSLVRGTGSSGIYLETGSKQSLVVGNDITGNGFRENGPGGQQFSIGGTDLWFWGVGREGISVDGSYENVIRDNALEGNSAGGIFLYKNCGEYPDRNPGRYFDRRDHADDNLIEGNSFDGGRNGVWVGSRMGENTLPMECSDPAYVDEAARRVVLDHAARNIVRGNEFHDVTYGIRVEDDDTVVEGNHFDASTPDHHAVIIGTPDRTTVLKRPVDGTVLRGNVADITGNDSPYRWVHGHTATTAEGNEALGEPSDLCQGVAIPRQQFIFVIALQVAPADGSKPPTPDLSVPTVGALKSCQRTVGETTTSTTTTTPTGTSPAADAPPATPMPGTASYTG